MPALVETLVRLPVSLQAHFLLLCASIQACMAHLLQAVPGQMLVPKMDGGRMDGREEGGGGGGVKDMWLGDGRVLSGIEPSPNEDGG